jgi:ribosome-associated protein
MTKDKETPPDKTSGPVFILPDDSEGYELAERACWHLLEKKAGDIAVLDLRGMSDVCDFFVLASGSSATQVNALAKHLHNQLVAAGHKPKGTEGMNDGRWALLDFFDVVVHVFHTETRNYYQLDKLWSDAQRLELDADWFNSPDTAERHPDLKFTTSGGAQGAD